MTTVPGLTLTVVFACTACSSSHREPPDETAHATPPDPDASIVLFDSGIRQTTGDSGPDSGPSHFATLDAGLPRDAAIDPGRFRRQPTRMDAATLPSVDASVDDHRDAGNDPPAIDAGPPDVDASANDAGPKARRVFVTSSFYDAALGGIEGADLLCTQHAAAAGLTGAFRAWLSTAADPVANRFPHDDVAYELLDGTSVASSWDDLVDTTLASAIAVDEFVEPATGDVWTGTLADGSGYPTDCDGFTNSSAGNALCGSSGAASRLWTENLVPTCSTRLRLYCFER